MKIAAGAKWLAVIALLIAVPTEAAVLYVKWREGSIATQEAQIKLQTAINARERQLGEAILLEAEAKKNEAIANNAEARQRAEAKLEEQKARIEKQVADNAAAFRRAEALEKDALAKIKDAEAGLSAAKAKAEAELAVAKARQAAAAASSDIYVANGFRGRNPANIGKLYWDLATRSGGQAPDLESVLAVCKPQRPQPPPAPIPPGTVHTDAVPAKNNCLKDFREWQQKWPAPAAFATSDEGCYWTNFKNPKPTTVEAIADVLDRCHKKRGTKCGILAEK